LIQKTKPIIWNNHKILPLQFQEYSIFTIIVDIHLSKKELASYIDYKVHYRYGMDISYVYFKATDTKCIAFIVELSLIKDITYKYHKCIISPCPLIYSHLLKQDSWIVFCVDDNKAFYYMFYDNVFSENTIAFFDDNNDMSNILSDVYSHLIIKSPIDNVYIDSKIEYDVAFPKLPISQWKSQKFLFDFSKIKYFRIMFLSVIVFIFLASFFGSKMYLNDKVNVINQKLIMQQEKTNQAKQIFQKIETAKYKINEFQFSQSNTSIKWTQNIQNILSQHKSNITKIIIDEKSTYIH